MTKVTFYLLDNNQQNNQQPAEQFACRLVDKAWRGGLTMHIHTLDESHCKAFDQLLWSWREDSFIPHEIITGTQDSSPEATQREKLSPITLGFAQPSLQQGQLLINLSTSVPEFFQKFARVCEIVVQSPDQKAISRDKFRAYRQAGIEPEVHNMGLTGQSR